MSLGFRLLAITPPQGEVDPSILRAWRGASVVGLAVLLREPGTEPAALLDDGHRLAPLRHACTEAGMPWLLSIDAEQLRGEEPWLATAGLRGVQLRGDPSAAAADAVRAALGPEALIGRSCHGAPAVLGERVDYSVLAPIFTPHTSAPGPAGGFVKAAVGLEPLRAFAAVERRVFALGGITGVRAPACVRAGAYGLAAIRSFFGPPRQVADDVARLVRALTEPVDHADPSPQ